MNTATQKQVIPRPLSSILSSIEYPVPGTIPNKMIGLTNNITSLIPQRPPFVMIDQLTWYHEKITRTLFLVKKDNIFVENGRFCEPGLIENIAQTAAARAGYEALLEKREVRIGYIGAIKNLVIYSLPFVNDELITEIAVENQIFDVTIIKGMVHSRGVLVARCEMKIFISKSK